MQPIIKSILDDDLYKISMAQAILKIPQFDEIQARYRFFDRRRIKDGIIWRSKAEMELYLRRLQEQVNSMADLALTPDEATYLNTLSFISPSYVDFFKGYRYNPEEVHLSLDDDGSLHVEIEGSWLRTIMWEVPLMAIISELHFRTKLDVWVGPLTDKEVWETEKRKAEAFVALGVKYAEFGTRRRFSSDHQELSLLVHRENSKGCLVGTSNLHLARIHGLKCIGTQAHEWFMAMAAIFGYSMANTMGMKLWTDVYGGELGIALSDTFTSDSFFNVFGMHYAKLFDGVRQDSGDPIMFAKKTIAHYESLGIDPMTKTIVFSDALNVEKVKVIAEFCEGNILHSYGIGTNLSADVRHQALNMVIKMTHCIPYGETKWVPTVKLSDEPMKQMGDPEEIDLCKRTLCIN